MHPRTKARVKEFGLEKYFTYLSQSSALYYLDLVGYLDFMALVEGARIVLTDSGGLQEETTVLRVPCLTLRENTERPVTLTHGTNRLVGISPAKIIAAALAILTDAQVKSEPPPLWDGRTAERIVAVLREQLPY